MKETLFVITILFFNFAISQTLQSAQKLENQYQSCLDKGEEMKKCSMLFYIASDSLLNVSYTCLNKKLNADEKNKLLKEQKKWLKQRNNYFERTFSDIKKKHDLDAESEDFKMIYYDTKALFVIKRAKELIRKLNL